MGSQGILYLLLLSHPLKKKERTSDWKPLNDKIIRLQVPQEKESNKEGLMYWDDFQGFKLNLQNLKSCQYQHGTEASAWWGEKSPT